MKAIKAILIIALFAYWFCLAMEYREYKIVDAHRKAEKAAYVIYSWKEMDDGKMLISFEVNRPPPPLTNKFWFYNPDNYDK
jgi:hypothetical protein